MKTGVPAMRTGVPCNENRFFPVWKTSQGKPCSGPVLALYGIAVKGHFKFNFIRNSILFLFSGLLRIKKVILSVFWPTAYYESCKYSETTSNNQSWTCFIYILDSSFSSSFIFSSSKFAASSISN